MRTLQAVGVMALWTIAFLGIMNWLNVGAHNREWYWALGTALMFIVMIVGNFWIFFAIGKEEPWDWVKNKESGADE
ncbi:MAG: hypothetical protein AB8B92_03735 [Gammaproteobacteria bacterium]